MKIIPLGLLCALLSTGAFAATQNDDWARGLDLEGAARSSDLIVVAKVQAIQHIEYMMGGKAGGAVDQYKFKPLRVLKGVFARDELDLMSNDLAGYRYWSQMKDIKPGMVLLLFLGRSNIGFGNANTMADSVEQSMPPLQDENDPLIDTVKTLLAMETEHEETGRVKMLLDHLGAAKGIAAIPLFSALDRRAWAAAQNPDAAKLVAREIASTDRLARDAAIDTASQLLAQDYLKNEANGKELQTALLAALDAKPGNVSERVALYNALGGLKGYATGIPALAAHLDIGQPVETFSEQAAILNAIGSVNIQDSAGKVREYLQKLLLDAPDSVVYSSEETLCGIAPESAGDAIIDRISKKCAAGLDTGGDIASLGALPLEQAAPALVKIATKFPEWKGGAAGQGSFAESAGAWERQSFAQACLAVAQEPEPIQKHLVDFKSLKESLVAPLAQLLDPDEPSRGTAIAALIKLDTDSAAKALQPHLVQEQNLLSKLGMAEFLGKHGIPDGYPYAIEHMSDGWLLEQAVAALVAIKDPKTVPQLKQILETSNDVTWNSAAIRALGAMGAKDEAGKFLELTGDWKNPLAAPALIALGDLGDLKALPKVREALASRKDEIVVAGERAAGKLLAAHPDAKADDVRDRLAALAAASDGSQAVRDGALDSLGALKDPRLDKALAAAANDPGFAHTEAFLKTLKEHKIVLAD